MRVLIYKRTHHGDPDDRGCFGAMDCMGRVRGWNYAAVIGVGGIGREATDTGLAGLINWIGIGAHHFPDRRKNGPDVYFDRFVHWGSDGPAFMKLAPQLASKIYGHNIRAMIHPGGGVMGEELEAILELAASAPPSPGGRIQHSRWKSTC